MSRISGCRLFQSWIVRGQKLYLYSSQRVCRVFQCSISDHSLIFAIRRSKKICGPTKVIKYQNFRNYSTENVQSDLLTTCWDEVDTSLTVEDAWNAFSSTLDSVIDRHAPLACKRVRTTALSWLNREIRAVMRKPDYHHKRAQKAKQTEDWLKYKLSWFETQKVISILMSSKKTNKTLPSCGKHSNLSLLLQQKRLTQLKLKLMLLLFKILVVSRKALPSISR